MVTTVNGIKAKKQDCHQFNDGSYYLKGDINVKDSGECYKIGNYWVKAEYCIWDYTFKRYARKNNTHVKGIVDYKNQEYGYFTPSLQHTIFTRDSMFSKEVQTCDLSVLDKPYQLLNNQCIITGSKDKGEYKVSYNMFDTAMYGYENNYGVEYMENYLHKYIESEEHPFDNIFERPIGLEYETTTTSIPEIELFRKQLIPVRDGSIEGHELITLPLCKGEYHLIDKQIALLKQRCTTNFTCSLHVNFGNFDRSYKSIVALYEISRRLQDEIFEMLPVYKKDHRSFTNLEKDYCQFLPSLNISDELSAKENFKKIFQFVTNNIYVFDNFPNVEKSKSKLPYISIPSDSKWNINKRYYWINFYKLIFNKQTVLEFRPHHMVFSNAIIQNWILICNALATYAENNYDKIIKKADKIRLADVINEVYSNFPTLASNLNDYINKRKEFFFNERINDVLYTKEPSMTDLDSIYKLAYHNQSFEIEKQIDVFAEETEQV